LPEPGRFHEGRQGQRRRARLNRVPSVQRRCTHRPTR
jgi:hypothetical protein